VRGFLNLLVLQLKAIARAIISLELNVIVISMSTVPCTSCVVVLSQQQEQNVSHQQQSQDEPVNHSQSDSKNCTVVKDGRVVVIAALPQPDKTANHPNP